MLADRADNSDLEADGVFVEGDNAHDIRHSIDAIHLFGGDFHFLFDHGHEAFLIFLIGAGDIDDGPLETAAHVGDCADITVGNTVNIAVVITDGGGADGNSFHGTIQSVNADQVAHGDGTLAPDKQTGKQVLDQRLGAEGQRNTDNPCRSQKRRHIHSEKTENHRGQDKEHDIAENTGNDGAEGFRPLGIDAAAFAAPLGQFRNDDFTKFEEKQANNQDSTRYEQTADNLG